jgi:hypothetical protein
MPGRAWIFSSVLFVASVVFVIPRIEPEAEDMGGPPMPRQMQPPAFICVYLCPSVARLSPRSLCGWFCGFFRPVVPITQLPILSQFN